MLWITITSLCTFRVHFHWFWILFIFRSDQSAAFMPKLSDFFFMYESHPMQHSSRSSEFSSYSDLTISFFYFLFFLLTIVGRYLVFMPKLSDFYWLGKSIILLVYTRLVQPKDWVGGALEKSISNLRRDANLPFLISYTRIFVTFCAPYYNC